MRFHNFLVWFLLIILLASSVSASRFFFVYGGSDDVVFSDFGGNEYWGQKLVYPSLTFLLNHTITRDSVRINWNASDRVNYTIQFGRFADDLTEVVSNGTFSNSSNYLKTGLVYNTQYYYNISFWISSGWWNSTLQNFTTLDQEAIVDYGGVAGVPDELIPEFIDKITPEEIIEEPVFNIRDWWWVVILLLLFSLFLVIFLYLRNSTKYDKKGVLN